MSEESTLGSRYVLCGELASGGMATIYLGHPRGSMRPVAIKRLLKPYAGNPEFVTMFLDEVWLAGRVRHMNIVETIDVVSQDGELSLVMEYVEGETLGRLIRSARENKKPIPIPIAAGILCGVLEGLHAAHEAKDEKGRSLQIVHRDVSPQNVMVAADGIPRLLDFGVAKASVRLQETSAGQLKGKVAYMAPEQIDQHRADRLSDVYAAGVVLWEALTSKRLFEAENEGHLLHKVLGGTTEPPSTHRADIPPALDQIAMRAMSRDSAARFPSAREMARAIELATTVARSAQISDWVREAARESLEKRAQRVDALLHGNIPPAPASSAPGVGSGPSSSSPSATSRPSAISRASSISRSQSSALRSRQPTLSEASPPPSGSASAGPRGRNVLVIDDSEVILDRTRRVLEGEGYHVTTTTQTVGAAKHLVDCDMAIIDYHMPGIDGGAVITSLRSACAATGRSCLFYLYTADPDVARRYAQLGFDGCLTDKGDDVALVRQMRGAFRVVQMRAMKKD